MELNNTLNLLNETIANQEDEISQLKSSLQSARNQMASDKEVKYYLDENYSRITQELKFV